MRLVCTVTVYSTMVREVRAARSTRGGPQRPASYSYTVQCHTKSVTLIQGGPPGGVGSEEAN
jgi:hypothetical protein